jgi:hypothetical protein
MRQHSVACVSNVSCRNRLSGSLLVFVSEQPSVCLSPLQFKLGEMQNFALLGAESGCEVSHAACEKGVGVSLTPGCTVHHVR